MDYDKKSEILKALGHPVRLQIVDWLLQCNECNVNKMVDQLAIPQSTVSQHLGILKNKGILVPRKEGVQTCYSVLDKQVQEIIKILKD